MPPLPDEPLTTTASHSQRNRPFSATPTRSLTEPPAAFSLSAPSRLFAYVTCAVVSCHATAAYSTSHEAANVASLLHSHQIVVEVDHAKLFCCMCHDQVYNREFDVAVVIARTTASTLGAAGSSAIPPSPQS